MLILESNVMLIFSMSASDTEVHNPAGKVGKLFCKNWFPEFLEIAQFPSPALPAPQLLFPLAEHKPASEPTYQARKGLRWPPCSSKLVCQ